MTKPEQVYFQIFNHAEKNSLPEGTRRIYNSSSSFQHPYCQSIIDGQCQLGSDFGNTFHQSTVTLRSLFLNDAGSNYKSSNTRHFSGSYYKQCNTYLIEAYYNYCSLYNDKIGHFMLATLRKNTFETDNAFMANWFSKNSKQVDLTSKFLTGI